MISSYFSRAYFKKGYLLKFEKNPHRRVLAPSSPHDPWITMNWGTLRKQGYRGMWHGLSLPDGGRWPIKLSVWINTIRDEKKNNEVFMCLINASSSTKRRIAMMQGDIKDFILCLEGNWCVYYQETGVEHFKLTAKMWPFRRNKKRSCFHFWAFCIIS